MDWSLVFILNSVLLGFGLAMDAFSVSLANGLNDPKMSKGKMSAIAGVFAGFQFLMPLIGWICVHTIIQLFSKLTVFIPWIALILLSFIGGKMLIEGIKGGEVDASEKKLSLSLLMVQGIATSIDALSVGFTISNYTLAKALVAVILIGLVTFAVCLVGLILGKKFGTKLSGKAQILGGIILIGIGLEIFISAMLK